MPIFVTRILNWIRANRLLSVLIVVIFYLLVSGGGGSSRRVSNLNTFGSAGDFATSEMAISPLSISKSSIPPRGGGAAPQLDIPAADRMVVTNSQMSILTKNVRESVDAIQTEAENAGGFMVNKNISTPRAEGSESANITVRIPLQNRESYVLFLRSVGLKVINERISSDDVSDEFIDMQSRLTTLETSKAKFEEIMNSAVDVDEILRVQDRILQVQGQIERLQGQMQLLSSTSRSTLITINLSTDELALPFAPEQPWRPDVVFKLAVRSLLTNGQKLGTLVIWIAVYSVLWVPALFIYKLIKRRRRNRTAQS